MRTPIKTKFVTIITVIDPDSGGEVEIEIRKMENGPMIGLDGSFLGNTDFIKVGDRVYWNDPDEENSCSGLGRVTHLQHDPPAADDVISVSKDDGGEIECLLRELKLTKE